MRGSRSDYLPSVAAQAIFLGYSSLSPNYVLASETRKLSRRFELLETAQQAALLDEWRESFERLQADRQGADDRAQLALISEWSAYWQRKLS